jgi:hypothetical protein
MSVEVGPGLLAGGDDVTQEIVRPLVPGAQADNVAPKLAPVLEIHSPRREPAHRDKGGRCAVGLWFSGHACGSIGKRARYLGPSDCNNTRALQQQQKNLPRDHGYAVFKSFGYGFCNDNRALHK